MTDWRPLAGPAAAERRASLLGRAREYFTGQDVLAIDVPTLGETGVTDPNIHCMEVPGQGWLQSSPEYFMKRLLAAGYPDIYTVCRVFRDGEAGRRHLREFTLIEWYRRGYGLGAIIDDACALVGHILGSARARLPVAVIDYRDAFLEVSGVDPLSCETARLAELAGADASLRDTLGDDRDAWLDLVLATVVVPSWPTDRITVLRHYPKSQAALARGCPADAAVADRFEIFAGDLELANGYVELRDADEQAARMARDQQLRGARGLPAMAVDDKLLAALASGLPRCAGVALGFERLHMFAEGVSDIRQIVSFA